MIFKVMSTFSGCGGSSLGYQMADGKVLMAVECDKHAVKTYQANFPNTHVYHGDIAKLSVADALKTKPGFTKFLEFADVAGDVIFGFVKSLL